jgi:hypothetical protein
VLNAVSNGAVVGCADVVGRGGFLCAWVQSLGRFKCGWLSVVPVHCLQSDCEAHAVHLWCGWTDVCVVCDVCVCVCACDLTTG